MAVNLTRRYATTLIFFGYSSRGQQTCDPNNKPAHPKFTHNTTDTHTPRTPSHHSPARTHADNREGF